MSAPFADFRQDRHNAVARARSRSAHPRSPLGINTDDWLGFAPDLPSHTFGARAWQVGTVGLRAAYPEAPKSTGGAALTTGIGFEAVDEDRLPLDTTDDPVINLQSLLRTDENGKIGADALNGEYVLTLLAATGGDGTTPGTGEMHRIKADGTWAQVPYVNNVVYASGDHEMQASRDGQPWDPSMPSSAAFAAGAPSHDPAAATGSGTSTTLGLPVMVYCNNVDPVYVFPATEYDSNHASKDSYTELYAGNLEPFIAKCCFAWEGRMFYGSTSEAGTRHPLRIRWGALFDASPDEANPGAGFIDVRELNGTLIRFENLDPFLIVYFSDGIVFLERTGQVSAPIRYRVVTDHRGLLGGGSVSHISPREHFVIATDGFYILNASGEFREIGTIRVEGVFYRKWHDYFFSVVDLNNPQRIQCHYDQLSRSVRISLPVLSTGRNTVWSYDIQRDWMVPEGWSEQESEVLCFTDHNDTLRAALAWDDQPDAPITWDDLTSAGGATWESGTAVFGRSALFHGTAIGLVHIHDHTINTFGGNTQQWSLVTGRQPVGDVRTHTVWEGVQVELADLGNTSNITIALNVQDMLGGEAGESTSAPMAISASLTGHPLLRRLTARLSGPYGQIKLLGSGPVALRQVFADVRPSESRIR